MTGKLSDEIADELLRARQNIEFNMMMYGQPTKPHIDPRERHPAVRVLTDERKGE